MDLLSTAIEIVKSIIFVCYNADFFEESLHLSVLNLPRPNIILSQQIKYRNYTKLLNSLIIFSNDRIWWNIYISISYLINLETSQKIGISFFEVAHCYKYKSFCLTIKLFAFCPTKKDCTQWIRLDQKRISATTLIMFLSEVTLWENFYKMNEKI